MDELGLRLERINRQIAKIKNKQHRRDLIKMVATVDVAISAVNQASVECRRLHRETVRYKDLVQKANDLISILEQHLTFAALIDG